MAKTKFKKGDSVKFERNEVVNQNPTLVSAVMEMTAEKPSEKQTYIIEYAEGWLPNSLLVSQHQLDPLKKYLFVTENELTLLP